MPPKGLIDSVTKLATAPYTTRMGTRRAPPVDLVRTQRPTILVVPAPLRCSGNRRLAAGQSPAPQRPIAQRPPQQSPSCEHVSPLFRHTQRPPAQSIAPQHSALDEHALPAPVQHRRVPSRSAHRSPAQHSLSAVHAAMSRGAWHVVVVARHVPAEHVSPGQQSLPAQVWPDVRHTHQVPAAVPERAQVICPQHPPLPTPPSTPASAPAGTVHALPGGAQQRRDVPLDPHTEPVQQSVLLVHPVEPSGRHAATAAHRPPVHRVPSQQSVSSTQMSPAAWHWHWCVVALQSMYPQQSRSRSQLAA